eukprot:5867981-Heterocapsa_arctica.AAC.1
MGGPDRGPVLWTAPVNQFLHRVRHIEALGLALADATLAFKSLAYSVLVYTFQLYRPNSYLLKQVDLALDVVTASPRYAM